MRVSIKIFVGLFGLFAATYLPSAYLATLGKAEPACFGTAAVGRVVGAEQINPRPARVYCWICQQALRTYAHAPVARAVEASFADVAADHPDTDWVLGEAGWPWGGRFAPHKTHRNGTSVDIMVPLTGGDRLATWVWNRWGYDLEFDSTGAGAAGQIDFTALGAHLLALDARTREQGGTIRRVILAPDLQDKLPAEVRQAIPLSTRPSWVRHDDHYHVDFEFRCQ